MKEGPQNLRGGIHYHFNEEVELQEQKTPTKRIKLKVNDNGAQMEPIGSIKQVVESIFEGAEICKTKLLHEVLVSQMSAPSEVRK